MTHVGCGGDILPTNEKPYEYETEEGCSVVPVMRCVKCKEEIVSDHQIDLGDEGEMTYRASVFPEEDEGGMD